MNSTVYGGSFDKISETVYKALNAEKLLRKMHPDEIAECYLFAGIDGIIIDWLIERIETEDKAATLNGKTILDICENRRRTHFGSKVSNEY